MKDKNKNSAVFADILSSLSKYFLIAVVVMILAICFSGVRFVRSGNVALILRFGNLLGDTYEEQVHEPGLLLAFPYIIDEVVMVPTGSVIEQKVTTHYTDNYMKDSESKGYVITGDQNIAVIDACVKYKITDPVAYALCVSDMEAIINGSVSNAMVEMAAGMSVDEVGPIIKAQTGEYSIVFLTPEGESITAAINNEVVYTSPVSYEMLEGDVGYIRITDFEKGAGSDGIAAVDALCRQGARSLIFDVRSNPGGRLNELTQLLDYLLPEGELFVSVGTDAEEEIYYSDAGCVEMPMAVLINEYSISAAEFFAAAMSEYGWAVLVGEPSTGKARSQQTFVLEDDSAVHISTRSYLTPNRVNLAEQGGLEPDIRISYEGGEDTQLIAAMEYLS